MKKRENGGMTCGYLNVRGLDMLCPMKQEHLVLVNDSATRLTKTYLQVAIDVDA